MVIVTTSADDVLHKRVEKFMGAFGVTRPVGGQSTEGGDSALSFRRRQVLVESSFGSHVTHLVGTEKSRGILKQRTMKFMQAMAHGLWIVSGSWLSESVKRGEILAEDEFEIFKTLKSSHDHAPRRARLDVAEHDGKGTLFAIYQVYFHGEFPSPGPQKSALKELVIQAGGVVVRNLDELQSTPRKKVGVLVVSASEDLAKIDPSDAIMGGQWHCVVDSYWIMNSITDYCVEELDKKVGHGQRTLSLSIHYIYLYILSTL